MDFDSLIQLLDSTLRLAMPLLLACLAGLYSERAGIVDIGLEGKMLAAAFLSGAIAYVSGSVWLGLLAGMGISVVLSCVHGLASITFRGNQLISGVAINFLAAGLTVVVAQSWFRQGGRTPQLSGNARFEGIDFPGAVTSSTVGALEDVAEDAAEVLEKVQAVPDTAAAAEAAEAAARAAADLATEQGTDEARLAAEEAAALAEEAREAAEKALNRAPEIGIDAAAEIAASTQAAYEAAALRLEEAGWMLQVYSELLSGHTILVYLGLLTVPLTWWVLFRTRFGLRLRAVGENPAAVDTAGISVVRLRYSAIVICGIFCGIGGAYLSTALQAGFVKDMTAGRGFIALAALIFAKWRPWFALYATLLFGFLQALALRPDIIERSIIDVSRWFSSEGIDSVDVQVQLLDALPYILTVVILAGFVGKAIPPRAGGEPYVKER